MTRTVRDRYWEANGAYRFERNFKSTSRLVALWYAAIIFFTEETH